MLSNASGRLWDKDRHLKQAVMRSPDEASWVSWSASQAAFAILAVNLLMGEVLIIGFSICRG